MFDLSTRHPNNSELCLYLVQSIQEFEKNLAKVEKLRPIAEEKQADIAQIVLAWYLTRETIDAVIPGAKRPEQVLSNLKAIDVNLTEEDIQTIDDIFSSEE